MVFHVFLFFILKSMAVGKPTFPQANLGKIASLASAIITSQMARYQGKKYNNKKKTSSKKKVRGKSRNRTKTFKKTKFRKNKNYRKYNVKEDRDGYSKTYFKQKVTNQQQKKINRRFKNGYSPFKIEVKDSYQDTIPENTGVCKYYWLSANGLNDVSYMFNKQARVLGQYSLSDNGTMSNPVNNFPRTNAGQEIYVSKVDRKLEIFNPSNYDMNMEIFDLVCKQDTLKNINNYYYIPNLETARDQFSNLNTPRTNASNPIRLMYEGTVSQLGYVTTDPIISPETQQTVVGDPNQLNVYDINFHPSDSYPFNIYWKIVGKKTIKLQPGAIHHHRYVHKPKALVSRGYFGYRYADHLGYQNDSDFRNIGLENISSGTLIKVWGQVAGTNYSYVPPSEIPVPIEQNHHDATTLSGRIVYQLYETKHYYLMDQKIQYTIKEDRNEYVPLDEEEDLIVVNDVTIKRPDDDTKNVADDDSEAD